MKRRWQRKCLCCREWFQSDARNRRHQRYCAKAACRKASKAASQRRWLAKPQNRDYFHGPEQVARVRPWRPRIRATAAEAVRRHRRYKKTAPCSPLKRKANRRL
jgi:hypothetical protein